MVPIEVEDDTLPVSHLCYAFFCAEQTTLEAELVHSSRRYTAQSQAIYQGFAFISRLVSPAHEALA